jgi:hypothetical protein
VLVLPTTLGAHDVTVYGAVALKLKMSVLAKLAVPFLIEVNVPTAYIVPPHCTSWRICSVGLDVESKCGVVVTGVAVMTRGEVVTVTFTGSATCLGTPTYKFWIEAPGGAWTVVQNYSAGSTFSWPTPEL